MLREENVNMKTFIPMCFQRIGSRLTTFSRNKSSFEKQLFELLSSANQLTQSSQRQKMLISKTLLVFFLKKKKKNEIVNKIHMNNKKMETTQNFKKKKSFQS